MSIAVMSWAWAHSAADGADLLVLLAIADAAHDNGGGAYPSVRLLSQKARVSERTVQRCIRSLSELGELDVKVGGGRSGSNLYRVLMGDRKSPRQSVTPMSESRGDNSSPVTTEVDRGDTHVTRGVTTVSPKPSLNHQEPSVKAGAQIAKVDSAQTIVAAWCDWCTARPPGRVVGQIAKLVGEMLAEGIDPEFVKRGLAAWTTKGLSPSVLPSVVNEVMNARASPATSTADARFQAGIDLARQLERQELEA